MSRPEGQAAPTGAPAVAAGRGTREFLVTLIVAVLLAFGVRTFVVESFVVNGTSMLPTAINGEHVLVNKLAFVFGSPQPGEVIVFHPPIPTTEEFIKRVVATAGETVAIRQGHLYVDGKRVPQPYIKYWDPNNFAQVTVPKGDVFVLGDNRPVSYDSRYFGPVPIKSITGQAVFAFWPLSRLGTIGHPEPGARGYHA